MREGLVINTVSKAEKQFETDAVLERFESVMDFVESTLEMWEVERIWIDRICLLVDEAVMNIILYAYPGHVGRVGLSLQQDGGAIQVHIRDTGVPFDPTRYPDPDVTLPPSARPVGGLGIHFIRKMLNIMEYRREGSCNHLVLKMNTGGGENGSRDERSAPRGDGGSVMRFSSSRTTIERERDVMLLKVKKSERDGVLILEIEGRLHGADSAEFQEKIMEILSGQPKRILFDLNEMTRVDSMGLRAFIMTCNKVKGYGGKMALCGLQRIVEDVFDISGFSSFFTICRSREEALSQLSKD